MNYQALGDFTAHRQQARDACERRFALLFALSLKLAELARQPGRPLHGADLLGQLLEANAADGEFIEALDRANLAAPLCGKDFLEPQQFAYPA